jgi:hypothetical protein
MKDSIYIVAFRQSQFSRKAISHILFSYWRILERLLFVGYAEFLAPFRSTPLEDLSSTFGFHSCSETELAISSPSAGLVCPFHWISPGLNLRV